MYPSSTLGSGREQMSMLKNNVIQVYLATAGNMATMYPLIGVLDTPFAIPNMSVAWEVFDGWYGEKIKKSIYEKTVAEVMTKNPRTVGPDTPAYDALNMMEQFQITVLPITDSNGKVRGILHLHDILGKGEFKFNGT